MTRLILIHGDSDGVASGALAVRYYRDLKGEEVKVVFTHPAGLWKDLNEFASENCDILIADVALAEDTYEKTLDFLNTVSRERDVVYVDHHPLPAGFKGAQVEFTFVHGLEASSSELTYKYLEGELGAEFSRVFLFGAIGDYLDETPFVKEWIEYWDKRSIYFEAGVLAQGLEASKKMYDFKRHVVEHLSKNRLPSSLSELLVRALIESQNEEEMRERVRRNLVKMKNVSYIVEPGGSLGRAANYARVYGGTPVGVAIQFTDDLANMSLRSDKRVDLNSLLRRVVSKFGGTGGGHPQAAGARVSRRALEDFLMLLDKEVGSALPGTAHAGKRE